MPHLIVEYTFDPPITDEKFDEYFDRLAPCLDVRGVKWVTSYLALDRKRRICVFDAVDAEAVRQAYRSANVAIDRVWAAEQITDDDDE